MQVCLIVTDPIALLASRQIPSLDDCMHTWLLNIMRGLTGKQTMTDLP